jgi:hypothetical protein
MSNKTGSDQFHALGKVVRLKNKNMKHLKTGFELVSNKKVLVDHRAGFGGGDRLTDWWMDKWVSGSKN